MRVSRAWCARSERRRLEADPARFLRRYDLLDRPRLAAADFDRAEDESVRSVVQTLKDGGIARWEGFLSAEEIEELCGAAQEVLDRARTISASLPPGGRQSEAESGGEIWRGSDPGDGHGPQEGLNYNYPPKPLVERLPGALELGTGRAGDAIFFDSLGLHAGSICWSGARTALVTSFNAATAKNDWIYRLFLPDRAP